MPRAHALIVLLLAASAARADVARFPLRESPYGPATRISHDGYHMVRLDEDKRRIWLDGKEVYRAPGSPRDDVYPMVAISDDGTAWALQCGEWDDDGKLIGLILTINGHEMRPRYASATNLNFSPKGANLSYIARAADGKYNLVSAQGPGPQFEVMPGQIKVGDNGVLYNVDWQGRRWLYRDHRPLQGPDYLSLAATPDLAHIVATYLTGGQQGASLDGVELGRWPKISSPMIDDSGNAAFFMSTTEGDDAPYDQLYVAGKVHTIAGARPDYQVMLKGRVFWRSGADVYVGSKKSGRWPIRSTTDWVRTSPSGRHWAFLSDDGKIVTLVVDGIEVETGLPASAFDVPPVFDGENAVHYMAVVDNKAVLMCVTLNESSAARGICAKKASALRSRASADE